MTACGALAIVERSPALAAVVFMFGSQSISRLNSFALYQLLLFGLIFGAILIQNNLIYPLEVGVFQDRLVDLVSLLYLPHGVKVICALIAGSKALLPILVANILGFQMFGLGLEESLANAVISTACIFIPLMLFNYLRENPLLEAPPIRQSDSVNLFRIVIVLAFLASLINALVRSTLYADSGFNLLAFRYVFGDMMGTIMLLMLLLVLKKVLISVGRYIS